MKITGTYQSDGVFGKTVRITRTEHTWKSEFGSSPRIPAFTESYAIDFGAGLMGMGHFDGMVLRGSFHPKMLDRLVNGAPMTMRSSRTDFWVGEFVATRRDDGSFDVVIKRWDGKWRGDKPAPRVASSITGSTNSMPAPEYQEVIDQWRKPTASFLTDASDNAV